MGSTSDQRAIQGRKQSSMWLQAGGKEARRRRKPCLDYRQGWPHAGRRKKNISTQKGHENITKPSGCQTSSLSIPPMQNPRDICSQFIQYKRVVQNPSVRKDRAQANYCFTAGLEALAVQAPVYLALLPEWASNCWEVTQFNKQYWFTPIWKLQPSWEQSL